MRRKDREITDFNEICEVIHHFDVCRIALNDQDGFPYIIPLNFGYKVNGKKITLYFHGALTGHKVDLIKENNRACFEMDGAHQLKVDEDPCSSTFGYESIIGKGLITLLEEDEKIEALNAIMDHYHKGEKKPFNPVMVAQTLAFKLDVTEISGKRRVIK